MGILSNFSSIYCFVAFVIGAVFMLAMLSIAAMGKGKEPRNKVHFYVARDKCGSLFLYFDKPYREGDIFKADISQLIFVTGSDLSRFGLNEKDYANLKWEDEPVEVFLNTED